MYVGSRWSRPGSVWCIIVLSRGIRYIQVGTEYQYAVWNRLPDELWAGVSIVYAFCFFKGSCFRGVVWLCSHAVFVVLYIYNLEGLVLWPQGLSAVMRTGLLYLAQWFRVYSLCHSPAVLTAAWSNVAFKATSPLPEIGRSWAACTINERHAFCAVNKWENMGPWTPMPMCFTGYHIGQHDTGMIFTITWGTNWMQVSTYNSSSSSTCFALVVSRSRVVSLSSSFDASLFLVLVLVGFYQKVPSELLPSFVLQKNLSCTVLS